MKHLMIDRDSDKSYEVRIYSIGDEHDWTRYGILFLNDAGNWELWTGADFSSKGSGLENSSDDCVEQYTSDLDETFDLIELELLETFQRYNSEKFNTLEQLLDDFQN